MAGAGGGQTNGGRDIYKQLIDNDMVKELDDIEAISQQISQHAEVLYNSWKNNNNNNNSGGGAEAGGGGGRSQYKLGSPGAHSVSSSLTDASNNHPVNHTNIRERGGTSSSLENGHGSHHVVNTSRHQPPFNAKPQGYRNGEKVVNIALPSDSYGSLDRQQTTGGLARQNNNFTTNSLDRHGSYGSGGYERQNSSDRFSSLDRQQPGGIGRNSSSPRSSSFSSPSSSTRESPAKGGSSITHISGSAQQQSPNSDVGPLELLASPTLSGNLEELVTSFVSTDRAKQAARNTISSTIMRRIGTSSPNGSASPVRSPSPNSPLGGGYKGASPLRSPMLTNSVRSAGSPDPLSPKPSLASMFPGETMIPISSAMPSINNDFIHAPMQSIFSKTEDRPMSPAVSIKSPVAMRQASQKQQLPSSSTVSKTGSSGVDQPDSIPIPVKVVNSPSSSQGLKSPSVLKQVNQSPLNQQNNNPFQFPLSPKAVTAAANANNNGGGGQTPTTPHEAMPNLFDQFGSVKVDADENLLAMRRRFEDAKQRMALSLPAREGGLRPNSLIARSMFDSDKLAWGDDASAFLLEQLRRRNKRRMQEPPAAPHPELTPQQKQHIFERSSAAAGPSSLNAMQPMRRMLPGGSVAERVLMFEKSPSIFGLEAGTRVVPQRREPMLTGTALTPWRSQTHELQSKQKKERIVPISRLEAAPLQPAAIAPPVLAAGQPRGPAQARAQQPQQQAQPVPSKPSFQLQPPPQTFPRNRAQPSTTFRPPSLHLPGKEEIPKFYFPAGNPAGKTTLDGVLKKLSDAFSKHKNQAVNLEQLGQVLKTCGLPLYWKSLVWGSCGVAGDSPLVLQNLTRTWRKLMYNSHDESAQFLSLVTGGSRTHLVPEDLVPLIQDVVDTHPGLLFLKEATEFHSRYVHTVIARIFYVVNRSWSGKISLSELRRSTFLATLRTLQHEDDINQVTEFFSYEHFYVIYCKFWELDKDHDLFIDREDLARHNDHALSTRMIERIFCGAVTRGSAQKEGRMSYTEFVWFLLSEEDKRHPTAIEYWFRCMDLDGDGVLSMYELEYFYEEQLQRMEQLGIETLPFDDCLCQMLDMIRPRLANMITLKDLKVCKMTPIFFDTFFNLEKYLDHEQRDPFATQRETDEDGNEMSDWDRFAAEEYELLVAEEGTNENMDDMGYEDGQGMEGVEPGPEDETLKK